MGYKKIESFSNAKASEYHEVISSIIYSINKLHMRKVVIMWIPSHIGIEGNTIADALAKDTALQKTYGNFLKDTKYKAVKGNSVNKQSQSLIKDSHTQLKKSKENQIILFDNSQLKQMITSFCDTKWDKTYSHAKGGLQYRNIIKSVKHSWSTHSSIPKVQKMWNRIRMQCAPLNYYKFKVGNHPSGLCDTCQLPETMEHFMLECTSQSSPSPKILHHLVQKGGVGKNLESLLNDEVVLNLTVKYLQWRQ
jgi:hypothetical protein